MCKSKEEYLMLRDEIIHLDAMINNTINFFYIFIASFLAFALTKSDTIYILLSHIVTFPTYMIVTGRRIAICKIAAYLHVFHEGEMFNWETRSLEFRSNNRPKIFGYIDDIHIPFLFVNIAIFLLYIHHTHWNELFTIYEMSKFFFEIIIFIVFIILVTKNRKVSTAYYVEDWKRI